MCTTQIPSFNGLSLQHVDVLRNIPSLIEVGCLLTASTKTEYEEVGDFILWLARDYSIAACDHIQTITGQKFERVIPLQPGDTLTIGARIRQLRKERMLTQAELAKSVDVQPNLVTMWENSTTEPPASAIIPLANALKCDPMWLLDGPSELTNIIRGVNMSSVGKRIREARESLGMTPDELERILNAPEGTVFRWETRKATPSSKYIDELAKALNTSVTWLLTGRHVTPENPSDTTGQQHRRAFQQAGDVSHEVLQQ